MSFQAIPPDRLFQVLNNTGLQNKDTPLYQLLFSMIAALQKLNVASGGSGGGGGSSITNITNFIQQILEGSGSGGDSDGFVIPGPPGANGLNGAQGPPGFSDDSGGGDSDGLMIPGPKGDDGPMVPYFIGINETFFVPLYKQALFSMNIDNEGTLEIDGFLIEVD